MRTLLLAPLLAIFALSATGCSTVSYLLQAGQGQLALYNHERPLAEVIADPNTPEKVRERLKWVPEIKALVETELGVKATTNYTTYVQLDRPYVDWSLTAAEPFELKEVMWSFPFFGSFPYLGFFKLKTANEWADDYRAKGYDTYVRGVSAYSTLGYLRDPLLSSMLSRDKADMVNLIFHESTHDQIYIHSYVDFNEQIASYIGDAGERLYIEKQFGAASTEMKAWVADRADRRRFGALLREHADGLKSYFTSSAGLDESVRQGGKDERYAALRKALETEPWKGRGYGRLAKLVTNNAALLAFLTYEDDQPIFDKLDEVCKSSPGDALKFLKAFEKDWDHKRSGQPDLKPQDLLKERLLGHDLRDAGRGVCLYVDGQ